MKNYNLNLFLGMMLSVILAASCGNNTNPAVDSRVERLPYYDSAEFTPRWLAEDSAALENFHQIPAFQFTNQTGDIVSEKTVDGKIYIVDFFFTTCPGICPKMTTNMRVVQEAFKDDAEVLLLSHSVTPETDSIPVLKRYAELNGCISDKWHLVTGDRKEIYNLGRNYYFVEENLGLQKKESDFLHTENFVLIDKNRRIRGIYNGLSKPSVEQLIADVKTLQKEASPVSGPTALLER